MNERSQMPVVRTPSLSASQTNRSPGPGFRLLLGVVVVALYGGCTDSTHPPPQSNPPVSGGHLDSVLTIPSQHMVDSAVGLLLPDGTLRLDVTTSPGGPTLFQIAGKLVLSSGQASGSVVISGAHCTSTPAPPFCDGPAVATLTFGTNQYAKGEIQVGDETWAWSTGWFEGQPGFMHTGDPVSILQGLYQTWPGAEFGTPVLSIDGEGRLFFQSSTTGCVGNGTIVPHDGLGFDVYDVQLTIDGCADPYTYLNTTFEGLSAWESYPWDYSGGSPFFWLWSVAPDSASVALTFAADSAN